MIESTNHAVAAGLIFLIAYALIASERIHRTVVALAGAAAVLAFRLVEQKVAFGTGHGGVDWNVIFLLLGMMIIVNITRRTGIFQFLAIKSAKIAKGDPVRVVILLSAVTAALSALLDNVTTVLFMAPVSLLIADGLGIRPLPILIAQIFASNIGGTATLIGDPPNIMVGSAAELGFLSFIIHLAPIAVVVFVAFVPTYLWLFRDQLKAPPDVAERMAGFDESRAIQNRGLCTRCLVVLGLTFVGFFAHEALHLQPATVALSGAALLLLCVRMDINELLHEIEWATLLFFIGLFIMVGALIETGIIAEIAGWLIARAEHSPGGTAIALLWISAIASGVVDNIPFVATVNPMLIELARGFAGNPEQLTAAQLQSAAMMPFWWALALGACLGGNFTLVGASANVVVAGIAERNGHPIGFVHFLKYGIPVTFITIVLSTVYVWLRYL
ncbi:MAG: ArsB/NhaD family transporter [Armatimonadetes bacterium]|nr:ArsB/NhaD family transporter [Armatimonadota bacterium]